jgi:hypothetical protein
MNKKLLCRTLLALATGALLAACVTAPPPRRVVAAPAPVAPPPNLTKVFFYPLQGQSEQQQDRDRYECYNWSVRQTGFDPGKHLAPGEDRTAVVPARASGGQTIGAAAAVGAVIGAIAASPGNGAKGAAIGAIAGTVVGSAAAASEQQQAQQVTHYRDYRGTRRYEQQAAEYRRAMSACLEGRGYSVK